jgi:hypothetical protein
VLKSSGVLSFNACVFEEMCANFGKRCGECSRQWGKRDWLEVQKERRVVK